ncbi:MAG: hypothetical protein E7620_04195 [Ruminococcaceae bacterium]|nr:hypothetical protein [Oscillospiraceae bacterium]
MTASQWEVASLYLGAFQLGLLFGLIYDLFRITRIPLGEWCGDYFSAACNRELPLIGRLGAAKRGKLLAVVTVAEDVLFCVVLGIALILLFYETVNGVIRFPAFLLTAAGLGIYRVTLGRAVRSVSERLCFWSACCFRYTVYVTLYPFRWCWKRIVAFGSREWRKLADKRCRKAMARYTERLLRSVETTVSALTDDSGRKERRQKKDVGKKETL